MYRHLIKVKTLRLIYFNSSLDTSMGQKCEVMLLLYTLYYNYIMTNGLQFSWEDSKLTGNVWKRLKKLF